MRRRTFSDVTDGTAQDARHPVALSDHYFDVDERNFEDLISRAAEFAKSVRFYDGSNHLAGSWKPLFNADEAVVMADIISTDTTRMEAEFLPLLDARNADPADAARYLVHFALRLEHWYTRLTEANQTVTRLAARTSRLIGTGSRTADEDSSRVMTRQIEMIVQRKITKACNEASGFLSEAERDKLAGEFKHAMWELNVHPTSSSHPPETILREAFYSMVGAVSYLRPLAEERFTLSMTAGDHDPAMALFIAFAKLLDVPREKLNLFTSRHRDFYYDTVLGVTPKPPVPDSTFLVLDAAPSATPLDVPAGTPFTAGKAGGDTEIIYLADTDLTVTDAQVRALFTLHCARDAQISPESQLDYVNGLRTATILSPGLPGDSAPPRVADVISWPLFGADKPGMDANLGEDAGVGFAVASSALMLREGDREINLTVWFTIPDAAQDSSPSFGDQFRRLILARQGDLAAFQQTARKWFTPQDLLLQNPEYIFNRVVGAAFQISVTIASEWYSIQSYTVSRPAPGDSDVYGLTFNIEMGPEVPAFSPCVPAIHGTGFKTNFPVLRFCLNPQSSVYAYSLFSDLQVQEITIESTTEEATRVLAWNQFGQVDTSKPFNPFGPLPTSNSYLIFGNYDAARMNLTRLFVTVEWGDLPEIAGGFAEYYKAYGGGYTDSSFLADLFVLRGGRWAPDRDKAPQVPLFDTREYKPQSARQIEFDVCQFFKRIDPSTPEDQFRYDQKARGGFFRIDLAGPEGAFGHRDYPILLTRTLSENAQAARWLHRREQAPLPNAPYTPVVNRMTLTYTASSSMKVGGSVGSGAYAEKVYRLHPLGTEQVNTNRPWNLLPIADYNGNLHIGFSASRPGDLLTLLFHLREDSATSISTAPEPVYWSYLASDEWIPLSETRVLSDTTDGFLTSGIVTLDIPDEIDLNNTVMPPDLYWIRVSAMRNFPSFCTLYSVHAQALSVTRKLAGNAAPTGSTPLPPDSIKAPVVSLFGLRSVSQPIASGGGRQAETALQKITRISERLHHKARAVAPWDYERLVLEQFPDVFKVKCFPAMTSKGKLRPAPGSVLVVVVPRQTEHSSGVVFDPMLDAIRLRQIQEFLTGEAASAHAQIEVRNPAYDRILIRCKVRLTAEANRQRGIWLNRLHQTLIDYISPWSKIGPTPRFGWTFQSDAVEAFIRELPYVESVASFSMLHLTQDETANQAGDEENPLSYRLADTARVKRTEVQPRYPWSLAVPGETQLIESWEDSNPVPTGVGILEIGNTLVIE